MENKNTRPSQKYVRFSAILFFTLGSFTTILTGTNASLRQNSGVEMNIRVQDAVHSSVLEAWLKKNPGWRHASADDYSEQDIEDAKEWHGEDYNSIYTSFDFNSDTIADFAVIVVRKDKKRFGLLVFNGPFDVTRNSEPAFFADDLQKGTMLFKNVQENESYLEIAPMLSDDVLVLISEGDKYRLDHP